eukprot:884910-Pleurochrysis_carterae.AAC.2
MWHLASGGGRPKRVDRCIEHESFQLCSAAGRCRLVTTSDQRSRDHPKHRHIGMPWGTRWWLLALARVLARVRSVGSHRLDTTHPVKVGRLF